MGKFAKVESRGELKVVRNTHFNDEGPALQKLVSASNLICCKEDKKS